MFPWKSRRSTRWHLAERNINGFIKNNENNANGYPQTFQRYSTLTKKFSPSFTTEINFKFASLQFLHVSYKFVKIERCKFYIYLSLYFLSILFLIHLNQFNLFNHFLNYFFKFICVFIHFVFSYFYSFYLFFIYRTQ